MRLILGGAAQGKRAYAQTAYHIPAEAMADGAVMPLEGFAGRRCIFNFQLLVRRWMEAGLDPEEALARLMEEAPELVVIMDEVGGGIVPIDKEERRWREAVGRAGCALAQRARSVERLTCGLPLRLKP